MYFAKLNNRSFLRQPRTENVGVGIDGTKQNATADKYTRENSHATNCSPCSTAWSSINNEAYGNVNNGEARGKCGLIFCLQHS